jgi:hypothetical protein
MPEGSYEAEAVIDSELTGDWVLRFTGEDGRRTRIDIGAWPLPELHRPLATALAVVCGPQGAVRSVTSVEDYTGAVRRLIKFLDELPDRPTTLEAVSVDHLEAYRRVRLTTAGERRVNKDLRLLSTVFRSLEGPNHVAQVGSWLDRPWPIGELAGTDGGYSDREFAAIMTAARSAVREIERRFANAKQLMERYQANQGLLGEEERHFARHLLAIASTGTVLGYRQTRTAGDHPNKQNLPDYTRQVHIASRLFLVERDLRPLLTLAVGLSGRNVETIKELTADCEVLGGRAVRVELTKRRRGPAGMFDHTHWEIGKPNQTLHTPGGFYLLVKELTELGRSFSGTDSLWSIWSARSGHVAAFEASLARGPGSLRWQYELGLLDDEGEPLRLSLPRLKKTVDIRTTRDTGGHLPSSTRSNSMSVLFTNYLRGDDSVRDWAGDVITAALKSAELDARATQARVLTGFGDQSASSAQRAAAELGLTTSKAGDLLAGELDTVFTACGDIQHGPFDAGRRCSASFLMCLSCENALISKQHIPRLKGLLSWLVRQWESLDVEIWWTRHGLTWLALTQHIRPKFTPAEWDSAKESDDVESLLALIDGPKE